MHREHILIIGSFHIVAETDLVSIGNFTTLKAWDIVQGKASLVPARWEIQKGCTPTQVPPGPIDQGGRAKLHNAQPPGAIIVGATEVQLDAIKESLSLNDVIVAGSPMNNLALFDRKSFTCVKVVIDPIFSINNLAGPINILHNPSGIVIQNPRSVTRDNAAIFEITEILPSGAAGIVLGDDDDRVIWKINDSSRDGSASFFNKDNIGRLIRVYGTQPGDIVLDAYLYSEDKPCASIRATIVSEMELPYRANLLDVQGGGYATPQTREKLLPVFDSANKILRQVGIHLVPDRNPSTTHALPIPQNEETITRIADGYFRVSLAQTPTNANYVHVVKAPAPNTETYNIAVSGVNYRFGVANYAFVEYLETGAASAPRRLANIFTDYAPPGAEDPSERFIYSLNESSMIKKMQLVSAPKNLIGNTPIIGLTVDGTSMDTNTNSYNSQTIVHETLHSLGLNHRGTVAQVDIPYYADLIDIEPREKNVMHQSSEGKDIDLLQLRAIRGAEIFTRNAGNLSIVPTLNVQKTNARYPTLAEFVVNRGHTPIKDCRVEFIVIEESTDISIQLYYNSTKTDANGKAFLLYKANDGSDGKIIAIAQKDGDFASTQMLIEIGPTIIDDTLPGATIDCNYAKRINAVGGKPPFIWTRTEGDYLPTGIVLDRALGLISGKTTAAGTYRFTMTVSDARNMIGAQYFELVVAEAVGISSPEIIPSATKGIRYNYALSALGGIPPISWKQIAGDIPANISLDEKTGIISGMPTDIGTFRFTIRATDNNGSSNEKTFSMTINDYIKITSEDGLPPGSVGKYFSYTIQTTGGTQPFIWEIQAGSLPSGLYIVSNTGEIFGIPKISEQPTFTIKVADVNGSTAIKTLSIFILGQ